MKRKSSERIAIVGGGITGLFCALVLKTLKMPFVIYESTSRPGGRIRTVRLRRDGTVWEDFAKEIANKPSDLDFYAEFGPMRVELDVQHLLDALLKKYKISTSAPGRGKWKPYLREFPSHSSPSVSTEPKYSLPVSEDGKTPLQLLLLALRRIMQEAKFPPDTSIWSKQKKLRGNMEEIRGQYHHYDEKFKDWLKTLDERDYWEIQTEGLWQENPLLSETLKYYRPVPFCQIGFWNLLSDVLHHNSIMKICDLGTFYHLLPDNPNAAEWLVWWLRSIAFGDNLHGVHGGMEVIIESMVSDLTDDEIKYNHTVNCISGSSGNWYLRFSDGSNISHGRVIFALPAEPLKNLRGRSDVDFSKIDPDLDELLESTFGFPMVKIFAVVNKIFWKETQQANELATSMPTRELHYWEGLDKKKKHGMIMAYTDRPATSFWANYVPPGKQQDVDMYDNKHPNIRLKMKILDYIRRGGGVNIKSEDILWYGIRDWGRVPYGAANHAWRPERRYWAVMRRLAMIGKDGNDHGLHVCGEAYSDYHGFIEGSLRSAVYSLHRILRQYGKCNLEWLPEVVPISSKRLAKLKLWTDQLDQLSSAEEFMVFTREKE
jgi:hypothetical protein